MPDGELPLSIYRVLDLTDEKGAFGAKVLADLGADVIKVEPPSGDSIRHDPPFAKDVPGIERSLNFLYRNQNKRSVTLDLEDETGREHFKRLVATADVLMESFAPGYMDSLGLGAADLQSANPGLVFASVSEYGQDGPYRDFKGAGIVSFALSGALELAGFPDKVPCNAPNAMTYDCAGVYTALAVMLALVKRSQDGRGERIDISAYEAGLGGLYPWSVPTYSYAEIARVQSAAQKRGGVAYTLFPCRDGYVRALAVSPRHWGAFVEILGGPPELLAEQWQDQAFRMAHPDVLLELVSQYTRSFGRDELFERTRDAGIPVAPLRKPSEFLTDPNPLARGFFREVDHPEVGRARYPGPPYVLSETPLGSPRPAPLLGEHNEEILVTELGLPGGSVRMPGAG